MNFNANQNRQGNVCYISSQNIAFFNKQHTTDMSSVIFFNFGDSISKRATLNYQNNFIYLENSLSGNRLAAKRLPHEVQVSSPAANIPPPYNPYENPQASPMYNPYPPNVPQQQPAYNHGKSF